METIVVYNSWSYSSITAIQTDKKLEINDAKQIQDTLKVPTNSILLLKILKNCLQSPKEFVYKFVYKICLNHRSKFD